MRSKLLIIAALLFALAAAMQAACPSGVCDSDGSLASVQAQHATAIDGDTITLPNGTFSWGAQLALTKNVKLIGKSSHIGNNWNATVITGAGTSGRLLDWKTNNNAVGGTHPTALLQGMTFLIPDGASNYPIKIYGAARFNGTDGGFKVTDVRWANVNPAGGGGADRVYLEDWVSGVFDHCFYDVATNATGSGWMEMDTPSQPEFAGAAAATSNKTATVGISQANPGVVNWAGHGLKSGQGIMLTTSGSLPSPLTTNKVYFINVVDANFFTLSLVPFGTAINTTTAGSVTHTGTTCTNSPRGGYYSYSYPYVWGANPSNSNDMVYVEDCILQRVGFGILQADGPGILDAGGSRIVLRHSSLWCAFSGHGFDESGGNAGLAINEAYNNFYYSPPGNDAAIHNVRAGAAVYWNERYLHVLNGQTAKIGNAVWNRASSQTGCHMVGQADGTCWFDQNARGGKNTIKTTLPTSQTYVPYETTIAAISEAVTIPGGSPVSINVASTAGFAAVGGVYNIYINTGVNGAQGTQPVQCTGISSSPFTAFTGCTGTGTGTMKLGNAVVGPLVIEINPANAGWGTGGTYAPVVFQSDGTSPGVPADTRIGAVYAQGINGTGNANTNIATYTLTGFTSTANQWVGFSLRNRTQAGSEGATGAANGNKTQTQGSCHIVTANTGGANPVISPQGQHDPWSSTLVATDQWEMRYVVNGIGFPGGATNLPLTDGGTPRCKFFEVNSNGQQQYWPSQRADGIWFWDCKEASSIANLAADVITNSVFSYDIPGTSRLAQGGIHNAVRTVANGANQTIQSQASTADNLRIGADWDSTTFGGIDKTGTVVSTVASSIPSTDTHWPATAAYGATYPHPLVSGTSAPSNINPASASFSVGVAGSVTITASGNPAPTFSMPTPGTGGVPSWATLNATTGILSGTPPNTSGSPFTFTITAHNTESPDATRSFTLTVNSSNNLPTVSIATDATTFTAPAAITITASPTDTDGTITKVDFYVAGTVLIGTTNAAPWVFNWTNVAVGNYSVTAKATDNASGVSPASNAIAISVNAGSTAPTPPSNINVRP